MELMICGERSNWAASRQPLVKSMKPALTLLIALVLTPPAALRAAMVTALDKNKDGKVTRDEATKTQWQKLGRMDADGDGGITAAEAAGFRQRGTRPAGVPMSYEVRNFSDKRNDALSYGWLRPEKVELGKRYPLVLCLHGAGGSSYAAELLAAARMRDRYPCFVMAPGSNKKEAFWMNTDVIERRTDSEKLPIVIEALRSLLPIEAIDLTRIYVTGQSMGGAGTWGAIATYPDLFAAAVPTAGAWNPKQAAAMTRVPVWAFHGGADPVVPAHWEGELCEAIVKAGGTAKYTEFPDQGHNSWTKAYDSLTTWDWLFAQRKVIEASLPSSKP